MRRALLTAVVGTTLSGAGVLLVGVDHHRSRHRAGTAADFTMLSSPLAAPLLAPSPAPPRGLPPDIELFLSDHGFGLIITLPEPPRPRCSPWREVGADGRDQRCT